MGRRSGVRAPKIVRKRSGVDEGVWDAHGLELVLNSGLCAKQSFRRALRRSPEFGRDEQLDSGLLRGFGNSWLHSQSRSRDGRDDDVDAGERGLDGLFVRVVDWDHLGVALDSLGGPLS